MTSLNTLNTPKEERDSAFYLDQFASASNWGSGEFEKHCVSIGFTEPDTEDFFGHRAFRAWEVMTEEQKNQYASDFDCWLDA